MCCSHFSRSSFCLRFLIKSNTYLFPFYPWLWIYYYVQLSILRYIHVSSFCLRCLVKSNTYLLPFYPWLWIYYYVQLCIPSYICVLILILLVLCGCNAWSITMRTKLFVVLRSMCLLGVAYLLLAACWAFTILRLCIILLLLVISLSFVVLFARRTPFLLLYTSIHHICSENRCLSFSLHHSSSVPNCNIFRSDNFLMLTQLGLFITHILKLSSYRLPTFRIMNGNQSSHLRV